MEAGVGVSDVGRGKRVDVERVGGGGGVGEVFRRELVLQRR